MMHAGASPHRYDASPKIIGELFRQTPRPLAIWPEIPGSSCERPRHIFYFNSACILQIAVTEAILSKWALEGKPQAGLRVGIYTGTAMLNVA